jgi:hypothetical protein
VFFFFDLCEKYSLFLNVLVLIAFSAIFCKFVHRQKRSTPSSLTRFAKNKRKPVEMNEFRPTGLPSSFTSAGNEYYLPQCPPKVIVVECDNAFGYAAGVSALYDTHKEYWPELTMFEACVLNGTIAEEVKKMNPSCRHDFSNPLGHADQITNIGVDCAEHENNGTLLSYNNQVRLNVLSNHQFLKQFASVVSTGAHVYTIPFQRMCRDKVGNPVYMTYNFVVDGGRSYVQRL